MTHHSDATFTTGNVMRHVSVTSLTASIGLMAIYAVDLVDLLFISMLGYESLAAAAGYASALMFFISSINSYSVRRSPGCSGPRTSRVH